MGSPNRRSLTILNVAYPLAGVGSDSVGGAEQVVSQLDEGLTRAGHVSIVIAAEGSEVAGTLVSTPQWREPFDSEVSATAAASHSLAIQTALNQWPIEVIHLHGIDFHRYLPASDCPVLVTLHLPPGWYPPQIFLPDRLYFNCVSAEQQRECPACDHMLPHIENGVSLPLFSARHAKRKFVFALGRICPEKGFHIALDAAKRAGFPMFLAGKVYGYASHEAYFHEQILPRLASSRVFIGSAGLARKRRLLTAATCLLAPSLAPETSSLVAMESLACGTPVVAFAAGALASIVEHGKTGFLVKNESEMADAIHACRDIDPEECRESARRRFDFRRTVSQYLQLYRKLAGNITLETIKEPNGGPSATAREHCRDRGLHTAGAGTSCQ
jgi:glycosyltransferase involved in cell wall biosynthesis